MTQISRAVAGDIPELLDLVAAYWKFEDLPGFENKRISVQLERLLNQPALGASWIARDGDAPVGYLLAVYVFSLEHFGVTAEIDELFVLPTHHGVGIGTELLLAAEAEFVRSGCTNVSLQLARGNDTARKFYRRHGYGTRSGYELLDKMLPAI